MTSAIGGTNPDLGYSDNRLGTPSKPLPAVPPKKDSKQGTLQVDQTKSLPVKQRTAADDE